MHRRLATLIAFVVLVGGFSFTFDTARAQSNESTIQGMVCSTDYPEERYAAEGCYGGGLPGATVTLTDPDGGLLGGESTTTTTTSEYGDFHFGGLADGDYELSVERAGFEPATRSITLAGKAFVEFSLQGEMVRQEGRVSAEDGKPVADATLIIDGRSYHTATTDSDGGWSVDLTAGHYSVRISHPEKRSVSAWMLLDGQTAATFTLQDAPERTASIAGIITDQHGQPVAGATVRAYQYKQCCYDEPESAAPQAVPSREPDSYPNDHEQLTTSAADGSYSFRLYAGHVHLSAHKEGHANYWTDFPVKDGDDLTHDFTMDKFPPKTARIEGQVTGNGNGLSHISINVQSPQYGLYECSVRSSQSDAPESRSESIAYPGHRECAITVNDDGTFEGLVTPGYSIIQVHHDHWSACHESHHADGSSERSCGPQYMAYTQTLDLPADATTTIHVALKARPAPDATLSGYAVDRETQTGIADVRVSFSNQESYSYAWAETDADGSYKVKIRSGYQHVSVWADGYLRWEGVIDVPANGNVALDFPLVKGQDRHGGCCYAYAEDAAHGSAAADGQAVSDAPDMAGDEEVASASRSNNGNDFEDLGGGLGPYDPDGRNRFSGQLGEVKEAPGFGPVLAAILIGALVAIRRRR